MGGIACVNPQCASEYQILQQPKDLPSSEVTGIFSQLDIRQYRKPVDSRPTVFKKLFPHDHPDIPYLHLGKALNVLWQCSQNQEDCGIIKRSQETFCQTGGIPSSNVILRIHWICDVSSGLENMWETVYAPSTVAHDDRTCICPSIESPSNFSCSSDMSPAGQTRNHEWCGFGPASWDPSSPSECKVCSTWCSYRYHEHPQVCHRGIAGTGGRK